MCILAVGGGVSLLTACLGSGSESGTDIVLVAPDADSYSCDFSDGVPSGIPTEGVKGALYYLDSTQPRYTAVSDYISNGHLVEGVDLFFNRIFIPTRPFDRGFVLASGDTIETDEGNTLYEYFAIRHQGRLKLGSKPAGAYQLAVLSDDGSILSMDFGSDFETVIDNDGTHPTRMRCGMNPLVLNESDKIPFIFDYYQGPRYHISAMILWRPWPADPNDPHCNKSGNSYFFDSTQDPPAPTANYQSLLARGWEPIAPENYLLPEEADSNPCNEPAPIISNFQALSVGTDFILLSWSTDRPATSQVQYQQQSGGPLDLTVSDGQFRTSHSVQVSGLLANTVYIVKAVSASTSGLTTESNPLTVRTKR